MSCKDRKLRSRCRPPRLVAVSSGRVFSMSGGPDESHIDPHDPMYYAPRSPRERAVQPTGAPRRSTEHPSADGPPFPSPGNPRRRDHSDVFSKAAAQAMHEAMEPIEVPTALRNSGRRALLSVVVRFAIAAAVAGGAALILVMVIPASQRPGVQSNDATSISSLWQSVKGAIGPAQQRKQLATLALEDSSGPANVPLPLGMRVGAPPSGAIVAINGLLADARLTSGKRVANEWRVPASEISAVSVIPPDGFVGQMVAMAELRDSNGAVLVVGSSRLSWKAAASVVPQPSTAVTAVPPARSLVLSPPPQTEAVRNLDRRKFLDSSNVDRICSPAPMSRRRGYCCCAQLKEETRAQRCWWPGPTIRPCSSSWAPVARSRISRRPATGTREQKNGVIPRRSDSLMRSRPPADPSTVRRACLSISTLRSFKMAEEHRPGRQNRASPQAGR